MKKNKKVAQRLAGPPKPGTKLTAKDIAAGLQRLNSGAFRPARVK